MNRFTNRTIIILASLLTSVALADYTPGVEAWHIESAPPQQTVVVRNATVWTAGEQGILEQADVLVRDGEIRAVGIDLDAPGGALEIDGAGMHVTPGIIDAHSHAAIIGGVNEATDISTAQVRIEDVIDSESINIYRQLAGGVTAINLLHGSANAIGGQMAVIKMRLARGTDLRRGRARHQVRAGRESQAEQLEQRRSALSAVAPRRGPDHRREIPAGVRLPA